MNKSTSNHSEFPSVSGLSAAWLSDARHGDPEALAQLWRRIHSELAGIARAVQRRKGGSPDGGVNGESDLVQSVAIQILANPQEKLADVFTTGHLRGRLYVLLTRSWIRRLRWATAEIHGGGNVRQASQMGSSDDSSPLDVAGCGCDDITTPTEDDAAELVKQMLSVFEPGSERQRILLMTLAGLTQEEIGQELGLSRDAVGRRVRDSIVPTLQRKLADTDTPPSDAGENP